MSRCNKYRKSKKTRTTYIINKILSFYIFTISMIMNIKKCLKIRINWDIENDWFDYQYERVSENIVMSEDKNLDWKI